MGMIFRLIVGLSTALLLTACPDSSSDLNAVAGEAIPSLCYTNANYHAQHANGVCAGVPSPSTNGNETNIQSHPQCADQSYAQYNPGICGSPIANSQYGHCFNVSNCSGNQIYIPPFNQANDPCVCPAGTSKSIDPVIGQVVCIPEDQNYRYTSLNIGFTIVKRKGEKTQKAGYLEFFHERGTTRGGSAVQPIGQCNDGGVSNPGAGRVLCNPNADGLRFCQNRFGSTFRCKQDPIDPAIGFCSE